MRKNFEIYTRSEYFQDLTSRIAKCGSGDKVAVATMAFDPADPGVAALLRQLGAAARRGAEVSLTVDAFIFLLRHGVWPGPMFWPGRRPGRLIQPYSGVMKALEELAAAGGKYAITNRPSRSFTTPVAGRSHIKFGIVNDRVYIGGCNLDWQTKVDIMAGWDDARTAAWLGGIGQKMVESGNSLTAVGGRDQAFEVDAASTLLVDAGKRGQSLIFDKAMELIDNARERVFIACQYFPNDVTAEHLLAAYNRGVQVEIMYNDPRHHSFPHNFLHQWVVAREQRRMPASFFVHSVPPGQAFLHAKLLCSEQAVLMGSHNLVNAGVQLGTAEIALLSSDIELGRVAVESLRRQINR